MQTGPQLRRLFVTLLNECNPTHPDRLWMRFRDDICDDLARKLQDKGLNPAPDDIYDYGLYLIDNELNFLGKTLKNIAGMPQPDYARWDELDGNRLIAEQRNYDVDEQRRMADEHILKLNDGQHNAFNKIFSAVMNGNPKLFFLHGPAGTGKTFCYKTLCYALRAERRIVLCVASSGIASLLLPSGRTAHSTFRIPLDLFEEKSCHIPKRGDLADLLRQVALVIWDEVPMQERLCQESVDLTFKDIRNDQRPFGGVTVVFGGDFQQTLPVVVKGRREDIVAKCLQASRLWKDLEVLHLTENKRLDGSNEEEKKFAEWLLDIGHGRNSDENGYVHLLPSMRCGTSVTSLIDAIYSEICGKNPEMNNDQYFRERTILSARNDEVDDMNQLILDQLPGEERVFHSADSVNVEHGIDGEFQYPVEYLNSIKLTGMPISRLCLKKGAPIMILCNIDPKNGICNGTRAILTQFTNRVLEVRVLTGVKAGEIALIPRITIKSKESDLPFDFQRHQFPVRLAFSMSINKSQGQSVTHVGLNLQTAVFTHGQLYVALSRCTSSQQIKVLVKEELMNEFKTPNIVFPEVLLD